MCKVQGSNIKQLFDEVVRKTQDISNPKTDELFEQWAENKKRFVEFFRGNLIYEVPEEVTFNSSLRAKEQKFEEFMWSCKHQFHLDEKTISFLNSQKKGFFENRVVNSEHNIQVGSKLSKSLKFFIRDKETLTDLQNYISRMVQEETVKGQICFSIHPLDYLSCSENNHNWTSCHSLDGERRSGNLNYMADKHTIVCYLKSKEDMQIGNFPSSVKWNSKKWRVFLYINEDNSIVFSGKQYPFESDTAMDYVRDWVLKTFEGFSSWQKIERNKKTSICEPFYIEDKKYLLEDLLSNTENTVQFNDVVLSTSYDPIFMYRGTEFKKMLIGEPVKCLDCGDCVIAFGERMKCEECNDGFYCGYCGDYASEEEPYEIDGVKLCEYCYTTETEYCAICGELHLTDNLVYSQKACGYICNECVENEDERYEREQEYRNLQGF